MITYNRAAALEYARKWAHNRNPKYADFSKMGGDCTNFISQCLFAGGLKMDYRPNGWFYTNLNNRAPAFSGVEPLFMWLNRLYGAEMPLKSLLVGDIIQLSFDGIKYSHSLLVTSQSPNIRVATHSDDSFDRPLETYNYLSARGIHILG